MVNSNCAGWLKRCTLSAFLGGWLFGSSAWAGGPPSLEGVWKLVPPQATLKPADGQEIPFTPDGRKDYEENKASAAKGDYVFDKTESRCSSPGMPRLMLTPWLIKIYQRPDMVTLLFQWNRLERQILVALPPQSVQTGGPGGGGPDAESMKGETHGRWEGGVLVATSTKFSDKLLDALIPSSQDLTLTEHIRLKDKNTLEDRITIQDPDNFTRPWDAVLTYKRQSDDLYPFQEDVCLDRKQAGELPLPH